MKISVIDIGSNSIRYMTAESGKDGFSFSDKTLSTTRLAENQNPDMYLKDAPIQRSVHALKEMSETSKAQNLPCYVYATSAVREAKNQDGFLALVKECTGLDIHVLSGDEEAFYAYQAACPDGGAMIDIGGGSFQLTSGNKKISYPLGCVRLHDFTGRQTLSGLRQFHFPYVDEVFGFENIDNWKAVGGTATTLAGLALGLETYSPEKISSCVFTPETLLGLLERLDSLGEEKRSEHPLMKRRYDTILGGGYLLYLLMQKNGIGSIRISDSDGMEGYAVHILKNL